MASIAMTVGSRCAVSNETLARADALKVQGNEALANFKFLLAVELYTKAIELAPSAIFYANRAAAHVKSENYGSAIDDASSAIDLDARYVKGWYRYLWWENSEGKRHDIGLTEALLPLRG